MAQMSWPQWQQQVLNKIRHDYADVLEQPGFDDLDWAAWRSLYDEGRSAADAVDYAFVRIESTPEPPMRRESH